MKKTIKHLFTLFALSLMAMSCDSVIYDDLAECPQGLVIELRPRYAAVNVFEGEVNDVHITLLDANNSAVKQIEVAEDELKANNYSVEVTGIAPGDYSLVVWNGLCDTENYTLQSDYGVKLRRENNTTANSFKPLWHGAVDKVTVVKNEQGRVLVPMIKDTNDVVAMLHSNTGEDLDPNQFSFYITADNSAMAADNSLTDKDVITYNHFKCTSEYLEGTAYDDESDQIQVVRGELNTMRLTTERPAYLTIVDNETGNQLLRINLTQYILMAKASIGAISSMDDQEYLDTEDHYNLTFFLDKNRDSYQCVEIVINSWIVRLNNAELS